MTTEIHKYEFNMEIDRHIKKKIIMASSNLKLKGPNYFITLIYHAIKITMISQRSQKKKLADFLRKAFPIFSLISSKTIFEILH